MMNRKDKNNDLPSIEVKEDNEEITNEEIDE